MLKWPKQNETKNLKEKKKTNIKQNYMALSGRLEWGGIEPTVSSV